MGSRAIAFINGTRINVGTWTQTNVWIFSFIAEQTAWSTFIQLTFIQLSR